MIAAPTQHLPALGKQILPSSLCGFPGWTGGYGCGQHVFIIAGLN